MTPSLLAWASSAYATPSPLPARSERLRTTGAWPLGLLPHALLAADVVDRGASYRDGVGYLIEGTRADAVAVGRLAAHVLDNAADLLDAEGWGGLRHLGARSTPDAVELHGATVDALRATARDARVSPRAAAVLARDLRPFLPAPAPVEDAPDSVDVEGFLARYDGAPLILRRDLWRLYGGLARPGGLTKGALFARAAERWGEARRARGEFVFRPASMAVEPAEAPSAPVEADGHPTDPMAPVVDLRARARARHASGDVHGALLDQCVYTATPGTRGALIIPFPTSERTTS